MSNRAFYKDFIWYFLGSLLPLLIGFVKTPIFTRHFDKEAFGHLGLITITFSYFGMLFFSWISSCIWRYYHKYYRENQLKNLYSNLGFLLLTATVIIAIITAIWYSNTTHELVKELIFYAGIQLVFNQLFLCYMVLVRIQGRVRFYTVLHSVKSIVALGIALLLVFRFKANISALILSLAVVDVLMVLFLILVNPSNVSLKIGFINRKVLRELLIYGSAGLVINLGFLIIASSDRYIIALLSNIENVGIYDQVYKISQLSIWALVTIYFNTINPYLLKQLEHNYSGSSELIKKYLQPFFLYGLPVVIYLSLFSEDLATLLLGEVFREGYVIMPLVFLAAYLHGISNFYELRLKFSNKLKRLTTIIVIAVIINISLTYLFVLFFGYKAAALTTAIVYALILLAFHYFDRSIATFSKHEARLLVKLFLVMVMQIAIYTVFNMNFELTLLHKILLGLVFITSYFAIFRKQFETLDIPVK